MNNCERPASILTASTYNLLINLPMKTLLLLGAALLSLCAVGQNARAGDDGPVYNDRPAPRYYEGQVAPRCYLPPPPPVFFAPPPVVFGFGRPYYHHRYYRRPYAYGYGYAPGIHIGIGL